MNGFRMYKGKKFQDGQRKKLLMYIGQMVRGADDTIVMVIAAHCDGMFPFRDQLDLHNRCLLSNAIYQINEATNRLADELMEKWK
jgi:hypothetical protein